MILESWDEKHLGAEGDPDEQVRFEKDNQAAMEILEDYFAGAPWIHVLGWKSQLNISITLVLPHEIRQKVP